MIMRRYLLHAAVIGAALLTTQSQPLRAGGPRRVAGVSYFDPAVQGTPLTWSQGAVSYYTDRGDLSPSLPSAAADAFVADAFSRWTSISTAAVSAVRAGQLAEDVSGANVSPAGGVVALPADILPSATNFPVAIVYDADGSVTSALLGQGAGGASSCFSNAAYGGVDNFSSDAHLLHALVILNGVCAQNSAQLPDAEYRLVRVLGGVLGLGWSQMNVNVFTRSPVPTSADYAGLALMHALDPINCVPVSICYPNPTQPAMDDRAALSRLYPVTAQNLASFPGKQLFSENTARIHGSVYFAGANAQPAQPMEGVNVVARWIDPATSQPSRSSAAASVSGFLFRGNAGNLATGFSDATGQPLNRFGSNDPAVEGFFDLAGLEIPDGGNSAQYELSVEAVDPLWSQPVGPYGPLQVLPSGNFQPLMITVARGNDLQQDIVMQASAQQVRDWFEPTSFVAPVALPLSGEWAGTLSGAGSVDYFSFVAQASRTLSVEVMALDESKAASVGKAQPVIGMWAMADTGSAPAPANTGAPFNSTTLGITRLDATVQLSTAFRVGIFDYRGDGRPDYRYGGRVFYADTITPARARVNGGSAVAVQGVGFRANTTATFASAKAPVLAASANQVIASTPAAADGLHDIVLADPLTGASSTMTDAVTYGAGPSDTIKLIQGSNPATPVGGQAPNPIQVQVLAPDGITPVAGASVFFLSTPSSSLSACGGAGSCTLLSDDSGHVSTLVTVLQAAVINISAILAPASYSTPKSVQATILGTTSALDLSLVPEFAWIAQGSTVNVALAARLLANGAPAAASTVNFQVVKGTGTPVSATANTDATGAASTSFHLASIAGDVQISACAAPANLPCRIFSATAVAPSMLRLEPVGGADQVLAAGQTFRPVVVRVTDSVLPPHPVAGANVTFQVVVSRPVSAAPPVSIGGIVITRNPAPVIVSSSRVSVLSDSSGLATLQPSAASTLGGLLIEGSAAAGASSLPFHLQALQPRASAGLSPLGPTGAITHSSIIRPTKAPARRLQ